MFCGVPMGTLLLWYISLKVILCSKTIFLLENNCDFNKERFVMIGYTIFYGIKYYTFEIVVLNISLIKS